MLNLLKAKYEIPRSATAKVSHRLFFNSFSHIEVGCEEIDLLTKILYNV